MLLYSWSQHGFSNKVSLCNVLIVSCHCSQPVNYDDGGSDSESVHDVYLERMKAEGQERDSEDGE